MFPPRLSIGAMLITSALLVQKPAHNSELELGSHSPASHDERVLRQLLARYAAGDVERAAENLVAYPSGWSQNALDTTIHRIEEDIKYHVRTSNRVGGSRDDRLVSHLRADRLQVLLLSVAIQLEACRRAAAVDQVGSHILESERAVDKIYALRRDFQENGPVSWPIAIAEPPSEAEGGLEVSNAKADWPTVEAFVRRWSPAAVSRLQQLVEIRLVPALLSRGLGRFPDHAELLLARGSLVETRLALVQLDASVASSLYSSDIRGRWRAQLSDAEVDFKRAVQLSDPTGEAAVRLARIRLLQGHVERAREVLDSVIANDVPAQVRYLALLFRAVTAELAGRLPEATRDYQGALDLAPGAQTPMLALSRLADEQGRPVEARHWVDRAMTRDLAGQDPWRSYIKGQAWLVDVRIESLRTLEIR